MEILERKGKRYRSWEQGEWLPLGLLLKCCHVLSLDCSDNYKNVPFLNYRQSIHVYFRHFPASAFCFIIKRTEVFIWWHPVRIHIRWMVSLTRYTYRFSAICHHSFLASCMRAGVILGLLTVTGTHLSYLQEPCSLALTGVWLKSCLLARCCDSFSSMIWAVLLAFIPLWSAVQGAFWLLWIAFLFEEVILTHL